MSKKISVHVDLAKSDKELAAEYRRVIREMK